MVKTKQTIKVSEARILIFLNGSSARLHYVSAVSAKLDIDYCYCLQICKMMHEKLWLRKEEQGSKSYYFTTHKAPIKKAKELMKQ